MNGSVSLTTTTFGSRAVFSCDASFVLRGDSNRTCESTGWSGNNPSCGMSIKIQPSPIPVDFLMDSRKQGKKNNLKL